MKRRKGDSISRTLLAICICFSINCETVFDTGKIALAVNNRGTYPRILDIYLIRNQRVLLCSGSNE